MPGKLMLEITVEAETEEEARLKILRRLRETGRRRRCSFFDEYCGMMDEQDARDCFLGWGRLPMADGYCPIIHEPN